MSAIQQASYEREPRTIEDELASTTERVGNLHQKRSGLGRESLRRRVATSRKEEEVLRPGSTDSIDYALHRVDPGGNGVEIMRLVHDTWARMRLGRQCYSTRLPKMIRSLLPYF